MRSRPTLPNSYQEVLETAYEQRLARNSRFSLAAFAKYLGISGAQLSSILNGKKGLSLRTAQQIVDKLNLSFSEKELFMDHVEASHSRSPRQRKAALARISEKRNLKVFSLKEELFKVVSDWQHFAILELVNLQDFQLEPEWIAQKLGLSLATCKESISRLFRVGLLEEKDGLWKAVATYISGPDEVTSESVKSFHTQILDKAKSALQRQPIETREFGSAIFAMDTEDLSKAKQMLKDFRRNFSSHFRKRNQGNSLYSLNMSMFRLDFVQKETESSIDRQEQEIDKETLI